MAITMLISPLASAGGVNRVSASVGPRAMAMCGAQIADPIDASAYYYNPAGLTLIENTALQCGMEGILAGARYENAGYSKNSEKELLAMPFGGFSTRLTDRLSGGIGWHVVGGLGGKYKGDFPWKEGMLNMTEIVPAIAYRFDKLSLGLNLNVGYAQFTNVAPVQLVGRPVEAIGMDANATGIGVSVGAGLLYRFNDSVTFGISGVLPNKTPLNGSTKLSLLGLPLLKTKMETEFTFPGRLGVGLKIKANQRLTLLLDGTWYNYEADKNMTAKLGGLFTYRQAMNWHSNFSANIGAEYAATDKLMLRAGFCWHTAAIPKATQSPIAPEVPGPGVGVGFGYTPSKNWRLDLGYNYGWGERKVDHHHGFVAPGEYKDSANLVSLSVTRFFGK